MLFNALSVLQAKLWVALGLITLKLLSGQKQMQEQNPVVPDNFVEERRKRGLQGRVQIGLQRVFLSHSCFWFFPSSHPHAPLASHGLL